VDSTAVRIAPGSSSHGSYPRADGLSPSRPLHPQLLMSFARIRAGAARCPMAPLVSNLSWSQQPARELLRLAWPITISMLSFGVMTLVDTLFVSSLGTSALAGVGLAATSTFALYCFSFGLLRGTKTLVSQAMGAGRPGEVGAHLGAGLTAALLLGVVTIAMGQGVAMLLPYLAETEAAGLAARQYLEIRVGGAPVVLMFVALREHRYGLGDSRSPMMAGLAGNALNIVFNWWMVMVLGWGVGGSALATLIGHSGELVVVALAYRNESYGPLRAWWRSVALRDLRALWATGAPTGVQFLLEMGSFALLTIIISGIGEQELAAHQIAIQVIHFSFLPTVAFAEAGAVMAGQAVGANRDDLVPRIARTALLLSVTYSGLWTLAMPLFATDIAGFFTSEGVLAVTAVHLLYVAACFQIADGAATVARAVLRGAGDVVVPARMGVLCAWVFTPPMAWLLGSVLGYGAFGGWVGLLCEITLLAVLSWARLLYGPWQTLSAQARERLASSSEVVAEPLPIVLEGERAA